MRRNMYLRTKILNHRLVIYNRKVTTVHGVNSNIAPDLHIPMIDCDTTNIVNLINEVARLQNLFELGAASICSTGRPSSFHVYFWNKVSWRNAVRIVSMCNFVDLKFLEFSLRRKHFTLRISEKNGRPIREIAWLNSKFPTDASHKDLSSYVKYETASKIGEVFS